MKRSEKRIDTRVGFVGDYRRRIVLGSCNGVIILQSTKRKFAR